jgi:hypothetical protein
VITVSLDRPLSQFSAGFWLFPKGWVSELLILKFRAGLRPPHHPPDYFITCLEAS